MPDVKLIPFDEFDRVRPQFRDMVNTATRDHAAWVDNFGLRTGQPGPLDNLIREMEACVEVMRKAKTVNEEGDD